MSKQTKKALVPKLRFPEFQDAGEWDEKQLGEIAELIAEKAGAKRYTLMSVTAGVGLVTQIEKFGKEIAGKSYKNYYVIKKGDFAYNKSSTKQHPEGQMAVLETIEQGAVPNSIFTCFRVEEEYISPYFLKYPFANNIHGKWLRNFIAVGARANGALNVDTKYLLTLPIVFPSHEEQQKIADCLSSIGELITAHTQKYDALKAYKKGLMQQLFPAEGETVPKLRFPEFDEKLKAVGFAELGEIKIGLTHKPEYIKSGKPFLSSKNISNGYIDFENIKYISEEKFSSMPESTKPKIGDILFTRVGSNLGNPIILEEYREFGIFVSLGIFRVNKEVSNYYIKHWMNSNYFWKQVKQKVAGGAKDNLNTTWLKEFKLSIPLFPEQQKIANFLSSIDDLITAQTQKIESLKAHKRGLMQQFFPSDDEAGA